MECHTGLNLYELNQAINNQFNLAFTEEEIESAIAKKGQGRILITDGEAVKYSVSMGMKPSR